jgi:ribosomal protein L32
MVKGLAGAFGFGAVMQNAAEAAKKAATLSARCPKDGTLAKPGTKFCPECGTAMIQPALDSCPQCGTPTAGAKFCPNCGAKIDSAPAATKCPKCGADTKGAKFCPECGTKMG